jgi:hypothetical protein
MFLRSENFFAKSFIRTENMFVACNKGFSVACNIATGGELLLNLDATRRQNVLLRVVNGLFS